MAQQPQTSWFQKLLNLRTAARSGRRVQSGVDADLERVAQHWDRSVPLEELQAISWLEHPRVRQYINSRVTGDPAQDWLPYVAHKYFPTPAARALSLGCGTGGLERHAFLLGAAEAFDAIDISPHCIERAQDAARAEGVADRVSYRLADVNRLTLDPNRYDAIFASMSIHHVQALERVYEQASLSLRPGGYFICNEYVGPNRFQLPGKRLEILNHLLSSLPARFRRMIRDGKFTDEIKTVHRNPPLTWFTQNDPSEAIRSADIVPVLKEFFDVVELGHYGGGILHFLLQDIAGNFRHPHEEHDAWLGLLCQVEHLLEREGIIESDFALIVATVKG